MIELEIRKALNRKSEKLNPYLRQRYLDPKNRGQISGETYAGNRTVPSYQHLVERSNILITWTVGLSEQAS